MKSRSRAAAAGDQLVLRDTSGGTGNLRVQEVSGGTTAADLGLAGINVAADEATGKTSFSSSPASASTSFATAAASACGRNCPTCTSLSATARSARHRPRSRRRSRSANAGRHPRPAQRGRSRPPAGQISADGKRIELADLTTGGGTFAVTSPLGGSAGRRAGPDRRAVGGSITGGRLISGLKTTLLGSLAGGQGLGTLGLLNLTDRSGATASVNLAGAETLDDVIDAINAASVGITAAYNSARNGLVLTDTTGATTSNLIVANGDATQHRHEARPGNQCPPLPSQLRHSSPPGRQPQHAAQPITTAARASPRARS